MNRRWWQTAFGIAAIAAIFLPCAERAQAQNSSSSSSGELRPTGTITVFLRNERGTPIGNPSALVTISNTQGGAIAPGQSVAGQGEWQFTNVMPGDEYVVTANAPGYKTAQQYVDLPRARFASIQVQFYLVPAGGRDRLAKPAGGAILAPRAQKEVEKGIKALNEKKFRSAQKHLLKALKMAPGNPLVNYLVGESWLRAGNVKKATPYLVNAVSLDPKLTQALVALGRVRYEQGEMVKAIALLKPAVKLDPKEWQAHWLLAAAYLHERNYRQASEQADLALKYGKRQADPARLILGVSLAALGRREKARKALAEYLREHRNDPRAAQIRKLVEKLRQPPPSTPAAATAPVLNQRQEGGKQSPEAKTEAATATATTPKPAAEPAAATTAISAPAPTTAEKVSERGNWWPANIDALKPKRISGAVCHLPRILRREARHAEELVRNLQKYSATEHFQEVEIDRHGGLQRPVSLKFGYIVFIKRIRRHLISVDDVLTPNPSARLAGGPLVSSGAAALELVFHPDFAHDFAWRCDGMVRWKGQPAWLVHFRQRTDRPTSLLQAFLTPSGEQFNIPLTGLAWVGANGDQVLHLEAQLVRPMQQVRLEGESISINYGLVQFRTHPLALWLPTSVDSYFRYQGHTYHQYARFSNFQLFWVKTAQKIGKPKQ